MLNKIKRFIKRLDPRTTIHQLTEDNVSVYEGLQYEVTKHWGLKPSRPKLRKLMDELRNLNEAYRKRKIRQEFSTIAGCYYLTNLVFMEYMKTLIKLDGAECNPYVKDFMMHALELTTNTEMGYEEVNYHLRAIHTLGVNINNNKVHRSPKYTRIFKIFKEHKGVFDSTLLVVMFEQTLYALGVEKNQMSEMPLLVRYGFKSVGESIGALST